MRTFFGWFVNLLIVDDPPPLQAASMVTITFLMSPVIEELFGENPNSKLSASSVGESKFELYS